MKEGVSLGEAFWEVENVDIAWNNSRNFRTQLYRRGRGFRAGESKYIRKLD